MLATAAATIPHGVPEGGCWIRDVAIRELTGEDEAALAETGRPRLPAAWATDLLTRCVLEVGSTRPVTRQLIQSLTAGDRESLLLQLRRLTSGDRLQCVLTCSSPGCAAKLDVELRVSDLLAPACAEPREWHEAVLSDGQLIRFRLPSGGDQEAAAAVAITDAAAAVRLLLSRCLEDEGPVSPEVLEAVERRMSEVDAQAETRLAIRCSECGNTFTAIFDAAAFLREELRAGIRTLYREVHLLAYHYHWSAREILGLGIRDRRRYLQLLDEELSRGGRG